MEQGDGEQAEEYDVPADKKEKESEQYEEISTDNFMEYSKSMFSYWTENDFASSFRKMLTLEQFRNEEIILRLEQWGAGKEYYRMASEYLEYVLGRLELCFLYCRIRNRYHELKRNGEKR